MNFDNIIGQEETKARLTEMLGTGRIPHALMFCGPKGNGKLPLALAFAKMLVCKDSSDEAMLRDWAHPDLHFSLPVYKKKSTDHPVSDDYLPQWRELLSEKLYLDVEDWLLAIKAENQQIVHYVYESDALQQKLQLKASRGGRRVVVVWLPERMMVQAANKLLKLIEEPPTETYFLLVSEDPEKVLGTIQSRTQRLNIPPLSKEEIAQALAEEYNLTMEKAMVMAHVAQGSYTAALKRMDAESEEKMFFDLFVQLMRLSYMRRIKDMRAWSEQVSDLGRESQKRLLEYCQRLIRENFMYNFKRQELVYETEEEAAFSTNFARFVNEKNVIPIMEELSACQRDIEQNVNPKMVFFDFALKMIVLLIQ
ncbi:MAG: DNA polymerase III subunit delta [Bacteroidaceae bacterium]|nr:DNA polymerase III subunit delta [Bacteroidaceae bacterium]